jgi:hypothetical protein
MRHNSLAKIVIAGIGILLSVVPPSGSAAIEIQLDYSYDTSQFFSSGNPGGAAAGAAARSTLEAAADFFSEILQDTFAEIRTPTPFSSATFNGVVRWEWEAAFTHPGLGSTVRLIDPAIPADTYRIFVGGRSLPGSELGIGGPGGFYVPSPIASGGFTQSEIDQINVITADFFDTVRTRGETSGFARWGGVLAFDTDPAAAWHWDHTSPPAGNTNDFFSVAVHELAHALGFGSSSEWTDLVTQNAFYGTRAQQEYGGPVPTSGGHWQANSSSMVFGTQTPQEAAMDPDLQRGQRKRLTALDAAGLADIGWTLSDPLPPMQDGDFDGDGDADGMDFLAWQRQYGRSGTWSADGDGNGKVDTADYRLWENHFGTVYASYPLGVVIPETTSLGLVLVATGILGGRRTRRREFVAR